MVCGTYAYAIAYGNTFKFNNKPNGVVWKKGTSTSSKLWHTT